LIEKRKRLGWTARALARRANVPYGEVLGIEMGLSSSENYSPRLIEVLDNALQEEFASRLLTARNRTRKRLERTRASLSTVETEAKKWSRKYERCVRCRTKKRAHVARGLCTKCYGIKIEKANKSHIPRVRRGCVASKRLTKEYLIDQYSVRQKSLLDIARECSCTRQYVYKRLKAFQIPLRDYISSRILAIEKGKARYPHLDEKGDPQYITLQRQEIDETFFSCWSPQMAWVLGFIYADGNLYWEEKKNSHFVRISQKEPEVLEKIKALMKCNSELLFKPRKVYGTMVAGELYSLQIMNHKIYSELTRLGLKPNKSLDIDFPMIPDDCVRHFIRGCWDGDGSVHVESRRQKLIVASYVSGSEPFIMGMVWELEKAGLRKRNIYVNTSGRKNPSYEFKFHGSECEKLYHFLYEGVPPEQYLARKNNVFFEYFGPL
jgi:transcriptional regulator with XRE-family HTH domain